MNDSMTIDIDEVYWLRSSNGEPYSLFNGARITENDGTIVIDSVRSPCADIKIGLEI